jgi:hypothetical protein
MQPPTSKRVDKVRGSIPASANNSIFLFFFFVNLNAEEEAEKISLAK